MSVNITVVGGGSYHWAPRLLCDFANTPSLTDARVVLHDLDPERLGLMQALGGQISVMTSPGKFTRFRVLLPATPARQQGAVA